MDITQEHLDVFIDEDLLSGNSNHLLLIKDEALKHALIRDHVAVHNAPWERGGVIIGTKEDVAVMLGELTKTNQLGHNVVSLMDSPKLAFAEGVIHILVGESEKEVVEFALTRGLELINAVLEVANDQATHAQLKFGIAILSAYEQFPPGTSVVLNETRSRFRAFACSSRSYLEVAAESEALNKPRMLDERKGALRTFSRITENTPAFESEFSLYRRANYHGVSRSVFSAASI